MYIEEAAKINYTVRKKNKTNKTGRVRRIIASSEDCIKNEKCAIRKSRLFSPKRLA
jgi:hypothetical protein